MAYRAIGPYRCTLMEPASLSNSAYGVYSLCTALAGVLMDLGEDNTNNSTGSWRHL